MKVRLELTRSQKMFGVLLRQQTSFLRYFWKSDLTRPPGTRQKLLWNDGSGRVMLATGRKTGKTVYLEGRVIRHALLFRARDGAVEERMVVTPGENQINPLWDRIINRVDNNKLFRLFCLAHPKNEHKIVWGSGQIHYFRIEGSSGTDANMVGLRCVEIIGDEMQLSVRICHVSRLQSALPRCQWIYCGVPNGVRHTVFWELDQTEAGSEWSRHKLSTFVNPLYWSEKARLTLKRDYGEGSQDYVTQVMGGWGEEVFSSFPPGSLAIDEALPYRAVRINAADLPIEVTLVTMAQLAARLNLPRVNLDKYAIGMDYGFLQDPTEIVIAYRRVGETDEAKVTWYLLARLEVLGANHKLQANLLRLLSMILGERNIAAVCLDQAGAGIAIATDLIEGETGAWWSRVLFDFNAGGTIAVDVAGQVREMLEEQGGKVPQEIKKVWRKQYFTQVLQMALLAAKADLVSAPLKLWLPGKDAELLQELIDTREKKMSSGRVVYLPRMGAHNTPIDHITDALRGLAAAALAAGQKTEEEEIEDAQGWVENPMAVAGTSRGWQAPWSVEKPKASVPW